MNTTCLRCLRPSGLPWLFFPLLTPLSGNTRSMPVRSGTECGYHELTKAFRNAAEVSLGALVDFQEGKLPSEAATVWEGLLRWLGQSRSDKACRGQERIPSQFGQTWKDTTVLILGEHGQRQPPTCGVRMCCCK